MARAAINNRDFYPADAKAPLKDDNIDAALAALKGIEEGSSDIILDIPVTIKEGLKQGGIFLPIEKEKRQQRIQVILMIDNGGWSMDPYIPVVQTLFDYAGDQFKDIKTYFFHNTIYSNLWEDPARYKKPKRIDELVRLGAPNCDDLDDYLCLGNHSYTHWRSLARRMSQHQSKISPLFADPLKTSQFLIFLRPGNSTRMASPR